jgi:uncharacterized protein YecE (DUF72 family)
MVGIARQAITTWGIVLIRIGTAGWSVPAAVLDHFTPGDSILARYAQGLNAVEINSSFYRPHQRKTYERWAASTPADFRFAVKAPRDITHERRLVDVDASVERFLGEIAGLGDKLGPVLIQLPPSLRFEPGVAAAFLSGWRRRFGGATALEPRHASWFSTEADRLLIDHEIARVAADPAVVPEAAKPGGWRGFAYRRLHGSPKIYASSYDADYLADLAKACAPDDWAIFDNTMFGAAMQNALELQNKLQRRPNSFSMSPSFSAT